jgi:hypothetical protein
VREDIAQSKSQPKASLRELVRNTIETKRPKTVAELAQFVSADGTVYEDEFMVALKEAVSEGRIELKEPPYNLKSVLDYLVTITISGWFWASMILAGSAILSVAFVPDVFPVNSIRWVLGFVFVLYLPGYTLIQFLFSEKKELDTVERFALSVGLSLAVVPLIGLILNYLPWGIRLEPVIISLSLFVIFVAILAAARKYVRLRENEKRQWRDELRKAREATSRLDKEAEKRTSK